MAGTGRAPKSAADRRNTTAPQRGDWIELEHPKGRTPAMPERGKGRGYWSPRTRRAWTAWWKDPASTAWGPADLDLVEHLADVYEEWIREKTGAMATEVRMLRDLLGLTPKGKQDRRWQMPAEPKPPAKRGKAKGKKKPAEVTVLDEYRDKLGR